MRRLPPRPYRRIEPDAKEPDMPATSVMTIEADLANRLSAEFHQCFSQFDARADLFAPDTLFDLLPPFWRFQLVGSGETFTNQLRSIAEGPAAIDVVRTVSTATGFVTEHVETQHTPHGTVTARRLHLCEVRDSRICEVTTYCNGGWDDELRARHAAEAPMVHP
jgi:hypothetical protein